MLVGKKQIETLIDDEDFEKYKIKGNFISISEHGYVVLKNYLGFYGKKSKYSNSYLHRLIKNAPKHLQVDHINGNRLDNRKENLRLCTNASNSRNCVKKKGKYKGVYFNKLNKKWIAQITRDYKNIYLGCFEKQEDAAMAYNQEAKKLFGKYAKLNEL